MWELQDYTKFGYDNVMSRLKHEDSRLMMSFLFKCHSAQVKAITKVREETKTNQVAMERTLGRYGKLEDLIKVSIQNTI